MIPNSHHRSPCFSLQNPNIAYLLILASPPANHVLHPLAPQALPQNAPLPAPLAHRVARLPNHGPAQHPRPAPGLRDLLPRLQRPQPQTRPHTPLLRAPALL